MQVGPRSTQNTRTREVSARSAEGLSTEWLVPLEKVVFPCPFDSVFSIFLSLKIAHKRAGSPRKCGRAAGTEEHPNAHQRSANGLPCSGGVSWLSRSFFGCGGAAQVFPED